MLFLMMLILNKQYDLGELSIDTLITFRHSYIKNVC